MSNMVQYVMSSATDMHTAEHCLFDPTHTLQHPPPFPGSSCTHHVQQDLLVWPLWRRHIPQSISHMTCQSSPAVKTRLESHWAVGSAAGREDKHVTWLPRLLLNTSAVKNYTRSLGGCTGRWGGGANAESV